MTVLFADVGLDEGGGRGPGRMICRVATVQLYGGTVEKLTGDGSWWCSARRSRWRMALFAAYLAVAHTDGAVHALRLCYLFSPLR